MFPAVDRLPSGAIDHRGQLPRAAPTHCFDMFSSGLTRSSISPTKAPLGRKGQYGEIVQGNG